MLSNMEINRISQIEKPRPALGDIKNRALSNINLKTDSQVVKPTVVNNFKNVKARVDTHWRKKCADKKSDKENMKALDKKVKATKVKENAKPPLKPLQQQQQPMKDKNGPLDQNRDKNVNAIKKRSSIALEPKETDKNYVKSDDLSESTFSLTDVKDIDLGNNNPILTCEYVNEIYSYLLDLERSFPIKPDHLKNQKNISNKMRAILIDWINDVHCQFNLIQETFYLAVSIIDRYLQNVNTTPKCNLQLVGITALFIASKYEELYSPEIKDFVYITDYTYTKGNILEMEKMILKSLDFNLSKPLAIQFLRRFSKAAMSTNVTYIMSKYLMELAAVEPDLAYLNPSEIAAASLYLALKMTSNKNENTSIWTPTLQYYSTYSATQLTPIVRQLANIALKAPEAKLQAVYKKYKDAKYSQVSVKVDVAKLEL